MSAATDTCRYTRSAADSRHDRNTSHDALHNLESALSAPAPGRRRTWLSEVGASIDRLLGLLAIQARTGAESTSLLSDIAVDQPRLARRIDALRDEQRDIAADLQTVRRLIDDKPDDVEVAALRDQLADIASRY